MQQIKVLIVKLGPIYAIIKVVYVHDLDRKDASPVLLITVIKLALHNDKKGLVGLFKLKKAAIRIY